MRRATWLLPLLLAAVPPASAEPGRTAAPFLQRALGARAAGMGSAFAAVRGHMDSLQYNPAGLATVREKTFVSTYLNGFGSTNHGYAAYAHPIGFGTLAASALYYNAGSIELNLSDGTQRSVTAEENSAWMLSGGVRLPMGLRAGGTYRFVSLRLAETASATSSQVDFGALWESPIRGLSLGAAYQYLGPDITYESAGDPPPKTFRCGVAFRFPDVDPKKVDPSVDLDAFDMTVAADMVQTLREKSSPRAGVEFGLTPSYAGRIALRFGWVFERDAEDFTFGIGFRQKHVGLDYSFGPAKHLGSLQQVSLSLYF